MTMTTSKITQHHLMRQACVYIRQSTPGQVRFNQESTERQYNLMNKAQAFGWSQEQIRVLDGDLGQSGSAAANRTDFKILVGDVVPLSLSGPLHNRCMGGHAGGLAEAEVPAPTQEVWDEVIDNLLQTEPPRSGW